MVLVRYHQTHLAINTNRSRLGCLWLTLLTWHQRKMVNHYLSVFPLLASLSHYRVPLFGNFFSASGDSSMRGWEYNLEWQTFPAAHGRLSVSWGRYQRLQARAPLHHRALGGGTAAGQPRKEIETQNIVERCRPLMTYESCRKAAVIVMYVPAWTSTVVLLGEKKANNDVRCNLAKGCQ